MKPAIITGVVVTKSGVSLMARCVGATGSPITQATLSSIGVTVSDITNVANLGTFTPSISASVFNSLQQSDPRWTLDSAIAPGPDGLWGYNWLYTIPATTFPLTTLTAANITADPLNYQADVVWTPVSGEQFRAVFRWQVIPAFG